MAFMFDTFVLFQIGFEFLHHLGIVASDGLNGSHYQMVETVAGSTRQVWVNVLIHSDFVFFIEETLDKPFHENLGFRIDARTQRKMMDQQAEPLQCYQGFMLEQRQGVTLQELIGTPNFIVTG